MVAVKSVKPHAGKEVLKVRLSENTPKMYVAPWCYIVDEIGLDGWISKRWVIYNP